MTVYPVIADPFTKAGAVKLTVAEVELVTTALALVGAPGTPQVEAEAEAVEAAELPTPLVAVTVKV